MRYNIVFESGYFLVYHQLVVLVDTVPAQNNKSALDS